MKAVFVTANHRFLAASHLFMLQLHIPFFKGIRKISYFSFGFSCENARFCRPWTHSSFFFFSNSPQNISFLLLHTAGNSPKLFFIISTFVAITNGTDVHNTILKCGHWLASLLTCNTTITSTYQYKSLVINMSCECVTLVTGLKKIKEKKRMIT